MIFYNEIDPKKALWLRELMEFGVIARGIVDERSIDEISPTELVQYTQCHFFAGIGIWSYALRSAGWPDNRPVWTGSCPCQPFSSAGSQKGFDDSRHKWPSWFRLIKECRPRVIFGEQVSSKDGLAWLDLVQSDLERENYAHGALDICAACVGAPHIRQRLYFVAESMEHPAGDGRNSWRAESSGRSVAGRCGTDLMGFSGGERLQRYGGNGPNGIKSEWDGEDEAGPITAPGPTNGFWRDAEWIHCRDKKWRATESGVSPLVNGNSRDFRSSGDSGEPESFKNSPEFRAQRLKGYGDAIVAPLAIAFIQSAMEVIEDKEK